MSGMVVRELFAKLGLDTDMSSFKRGDAAMDRTEKKAFSLADAFKYIGAAAVGAFALSTVKAASDVDEQLNVVNVAFGNSADSVIQWADKSGKAMGRSQYLMRDLAGSLGIILNPMLKNEKAAAEWSTTLADLSVDLSSLKNTTEKQAMEAIRSGLIGETEPLRQYGVILNDVVLKEEARTLGIHKGKGPLTAVARAQAVYSQVMKQTTIAQGDAIRTGGGFANLTRKLEGAWQDLKVAIGGVLLGPGASVVKWLSAAATSMAELVRSTNLLPAVLIAAGAALLPFIGGWVIANAPLLLAAAAMTAIVLVIEDIYTAMTGGKSVIDDWFAQLYGKEHWAAIKQTWQEEFEALLDMVFGFAAKAKVVATSVWQVLKGDMKGAGKTLADGLELSKNTDLGNQLTAAGAGRKPAGIAPKDTARGGMMSFLGLDTTALGQQLSAAGQTMPGPSAGSGTNTQTVSAPTTIVVNGGRDSSEQIARTVEKKLNDRDRNLRRSSSGVE